MNKKIGLLVIAVFLSVQMLSLLHMAEHRFEKHTHKAQICDIYLNAEQAKSADVPIITALPEMAFVKAVAQRFISITLQKERFISSIPRAPPIFS